jgi:SPP1 family holin
MDKMSLVRSAVLLLALVNQVLVMNGVSPLPVEDDQLETLITTAFTVSASIWAWWKNNYISKRGKQQKTVLTRHDLYKP